MGPQPFFYSSPQPFLAQAIMTSLFALFLVFASFTYKTGTPLGRLASLPPAPSARGLKVTQHLPSAGDLGDAAEKTTLQSSGVSLSPKKA